MWPQLSPASPPSLPSHTWLTLDHLSCTRDHPQALHSLWNSPHHANSLPWPCRGPRGAHPTKWPTWGKWTREGDQRRLWKCFGAIRTGTSRILRTGASPRTKGTQAPDGHVNLVFGLLDPLGMDMAKGRPGRGNTEDSEQASSRHLRTFSDLTCVWDKGEKTFLHPKLKETNFHRDFGGPNLIASSKPSQLVPTCHHCDNAHLPGDRTEETRGKLWGSPFRGPTFYADVPCSPAQPLKS